MAEDKEEEKLEGETCPACGTKSLTLLEQEIDIPYFGKAFVFSMSCSKCGLRKSDVEAAETKQPCKYTLDITSEKDMTIRVVKSSEATVKIPYVASIEPGAESEGYVTNVEGILARIKQQAELIKSDDEDDEAADAARKMVKKINRIMWGQEKAKLIIEDPSGNSAIISERALVEKLKAK